MNARAHRKKQGDRFGPPVEMRFIDMFMAALGALIFLAMLLSLLIQHRPTQDIDLPPKLNQNGNRPLQLITKAIPAAMVGQPYEFAFAYRGGADPILWQIAVGEDELDEGLAFSSDNGVLSGTPENSGVNQFVLRIVDASGRGEEHAYDLKIGGPKVDSYEVESLLAGVMLLVLMLLWIGLRSAVYQYKKMLNHLKSEQAAGRREAVIRIGTGVVEHIRLPEGVITYGERINAMRKISSAIGWITILLGSWFAWRVFF